MTTLSPVVKRFLKKESIPDMSCCFEHLIDADGFDLLVDRLNTAPAVTLLITLW